MRVAGLHIRRAFVSRLHSHREPCSQFTYSGANTSKDYGGYPNSGLSNGFPRTRRLVRDFRTEQGQALASTSLQPTLLRLLRKGCFRQRPGLYIPDTSSYADDIRPEVCKYVFNIRFAGADGLVKLFLAPECGYFPHFSLFCDRFNGLRTAGFDLCGNHVK